MAQVVQCLPSKSKALSSILRTTKNNNRINSFKKNLKPSLENKATYDLGDALKQWAQILATYS
jgi:hypothetical protein